MAVRLSSFTPPPQGDSSYSFVLEAESNAGPCNPSMEVRYNVNTHYYYYYYYYCSAVLCWILPLFKFLDPIHNRQDSLGGGSARHKATTYTQNNTKENKRKQYIHASSGIRTQDPSIRATEYSSCLRYRSHCDRLFNTHAKIKRLSDPWD
jgi:hypothetical protein